ncbi:hypothetical protein IJI31_06440 [bacterium]|nr:hypothetical protein [bacterium]
MDKEEEFKQKLSRYELVSTEQYKKLREKQLDLIVEKASSNYDAMEIRGMLKLIAFTDEWKNDFIKLKRG